MPAADIELTDVARGLRRTAQSNKDGAILFPTVTPGVYTLRVTKTGFEAQELRNITLEVGQRASYDVDLKPGQISNVVTVSAENVPSLKQNRT